MKTSRNQTKTKETNEVKKTVRGKSRRNIHTQSQRGPHGLQYARTDELTGDRWVRAGLRITEAGKDRNSTDAAVLPARHKLLSHLVRRAFTLEGCYFYVVVGFLKRSIVKIFFLALR